MLIELSKVNAPSLLLLDFNYLFNKAINVYINKHYNIYNVNLQTTDDLRVLKASAILTPTLADDYDSLSYTSLGDGESYLSGVHNLIANLYGATYEVNLPNDYLHMLNCICVYRVNKQFKCYDKGSYVQFAAKMLTSDAWSVIINDFYNRPLPERPYYFIHNVNTNEQVTTNPWDKDLTDSAPLGNGTDMNGEYKVTETDGAAGDNTNLARKVELTGGDTTISLVEKPAGHRYGNASTVRCEIRYGKI